MIREVGGTMGQAAFSRTFRDDTGHTIRVTANGESNQAFPNLPCPNLVVQDLGYTDQATRYEAMARKLEQQAKSKPEPKQVMWIYRRLWSHMRDKYETGYFENPDPEREEERLCGPWWHWEATWPTEEEAQARVAWLNEQEE